jgi:hypothetical protein
MRRFVASVAILTFALTLVACTPNHGEPVPETQKVEGKVTYKDGRSFTEGGAIEFRHAEKEGVFARGDIDKSGTFKLHTMTAQKKVPGAVEGTYTITIIPPAADQNIKLIELKKKYNVTKGDNNLTVVVDE